MENANAELEPSQVPNHKAVGGKMAIGEMGSPTKVFRSWSRPQINLEITDMPQALLDKKGAAAASANGKDLKTMQVCTCAKFRKRIELPAGINVACLDNKSPTPSVLKTSNYMPVGSNLSRAISEQYASPDHAQQASKQGNSESKQLLDY